MLRLFQTVVCAFAAVAALGFSQAASMSPTVSYPLALKTRWTYHMRQEFGAGVQPSPVDAALLKGNVLETTVESEVTGTNIIGGKNYARVESRRNGRLWLTEWMQLTPEGLFLGKTSEDGDETVMTPPQKILNPRLAVGQSWTWKASDAPVSIRVNVAGQESVEVPAGKFDTMKIVHEASIVLPQANIRSVNSRWFAPNVGYVRQETETSAGGRLLSRNHLTLVAFAGMPARP